MKTNTDGTQSPYELNISYVSALGDPAGISRELHARRFLTSQALMLAARGVPGIYFHSLVGTENDREGAEQHGQPRRINRKRFELAELKARLADENSLAARIFQGYRNLLRVRCSQPAFRPESELSVTPLADPALAAWVRELPGHSPAILVLANFSHHARRLDLHTLGPRRWRRDTLSNREVPATGTIDLAPFETLWLEAG